MKKVLCFGDSNTWGYRPGTGDRYPKGIRWTSLVQEQYGRSVQVIEAGLCGRTTVFEDITRPNRKGIESLHEIFAENEDIDAVVLMLGTNDCKTVYGATAREIGFGIEKCIDEITKHVINKNIILVSPILLGEDVWKDSYDPEFSKKSVEVSKTLKAEYSRIAHNKGVRFFAASDYVSFSKVDQEHMNELGHRIFADKVIDKLDEIWEEENVKHIRTA